MEDLEGMDDDAVKLQKPIVAVHLEQTDLPPDLELQIGSLQAIHRYSMSDEQFWQRLQSVEQIKPCRAIDDGDSKKV